LYTLSLHDALPIFSVTDRAVAMHPLAVCAAAASAVRVEPGVVTLMLRLARLAVDLDIVHLHIATAVVVGEVDGDAAAQVRRRGVALHARGERPVLHDLIVHP